MSASHFRAGSSSTSENDKDSSSDSSKPRQKISTATSDDKSSSSASTPTSTIPSDNISSENFELDEFTRLANHRLLGAYLIDQNTSRYYSLDHINTPVLRNPSGIRNNNPYMRSKNINISEEDLELQVLERKVVLDGFVPILPTVAEISSNDDDNGKKNKRNFYGKVKNSRFFSYQWNKPVGIFLVIAGVASLALYFTTKAILDLINKNHRLSKHDYGRLRGARPLVDPDTPEMFYTRNSSDGSLWNLVFSDEFSAEGRSFYYGDDPFWEAVDLHYAATENKEWYDPDMITTSQGCLKITLDDRKGHNLNYTSGMLQGWNRMCFTQGLLEASIKMPGSYEARGLWPAFWTLGNLGRAGYMASTEGIWPYSYDSCDAGITANQSSDDGLSFLPGQRLSSCVCPNDDHPSHGIGRGAPEIDVLEGYHNVLSQTYNLAPFDIWRMPDYEHLCISNRSITSMNRVYGSQYQEMVSALTTSNETWFDRTPSYVDNPYYQGQFGRFQRFAMEYRADNEDNSKNYIKFYIGEEKTFEIYGAAFHPDGNIDWRMIPKEPLYIIFNLGLSESWSDIDYNSFTLPVHLEIDYVRLYQPRESISITCDPGLYNTTDYISRHPKAYYNPNMTTWDMAGYSTPKNSLFGCSS